jgi:hypothetical protein
MSHQPDPADLRRVLVSALQLLAADYDDQVKALPEFVHVPDELALTFDDAYVLLPRLRAAHLVDDDAVHQLEQLHDKLASISAWTPEALRSDPTWLEIRRQASVVLDGLGAPRGTIDLSWGEYVRGKPAPRADDR